MRLVISRLAVLLLVTAGLQGCIAYEYEHEFWIRVDGSGTVNVTGRPALWTAFKGLGPTEDPEAAREAARALFERSGLRVKRVTITRREGRPYLFVSAEFADVNRLSGTPAFPDLTIGLRPEGDRLVLEGTWSGPSPPPRLPEGERDGLMAVRFHIPAKIHQHKNAFAGVERGNIVGWRQEVARALEGGRLDFGVTTDRRSILLSTVALFALTIVLALGLLAIAFALVVRKGRAGAAPRPPSGGTTKPTTDA